MLRAADALLEQWLEGVRGAELRRLAADQVAELLGLYGVTVMRSIPFETEDEAVRAAGDLGYPVAVKATNSYLRHRLDLGGVQLNIEDAEMLRRTISEMRRTLARYGSPGLEVQPMAPTGQGASCGRSRIP